MSPRFASLFAAACGAHAADQLALAALPLTAALALGAGPGTVGLLVALQSGAWLLLSLPGGLIVDRLPRRTVLAGALGLGSAALLVATAAAQADQAALLGLAAFVAAGGTVLFVLSATSSLPDLVPADRLPAANARIELARAVTTLAAPALVGWLASRGGVALAYPLAGLLALAGMLAVLRLPSGAAVLAARPPFATALAEGARFVLDHPLLRAIGLCAIFWNFAFFVLVAVFVPYALHVIGLGPQAVGLAQGAAGIGAIAGSLSAAAVLRRVAPGFVLLAGPGLSVIAGLLLLAARPTESGILAGLGFALIGFGPMLWLVCQQSLRQLVTPRPLLGRANATIQLAIYGVRPLGALAGGAVAVGWGPEAAVWLATALFAASFLVPVLTPLGRLQAMPEPVAAC